MNGLDPVQTAEGYLKRAIRAIDMEFGVGYAQQHPELIVAFVQASALSDLAREISAAVTDVLLAGI